MKFIGLSKQISRYPFIYAIVFIISLAISSRLNFTQIIPVQICFILLAVVAIVLIDNKAVFACLFVFALGIFFFQLFNLANSSPPELKCQSATIDSVIKTSTNNLEFSITADSGGRAVIKTNPNQPLGYKDKLKICLNKELAIDSSYRNYLNSRYKTDFLVETDKIELTQKGSGILRTFYNFADKISSTTEKLFPGDIGVLAKGLIIGQASDFSKNFKDNLQKSGTTHLVAVSGYNVSIITIALFQLIRNAYSRRAAIILSISSLIIFTIITAATPSVLRASIMGLAYIIAKIIGRQRSTLNSLFFAALAMLIFNPYVLWDIGFQLSFAATAGLILGEGLFNFPNKTLPVLGLLLFLETSLAQIFTFPILAQNFGRLSLVAPLANLLILPFVPAAMLFIAVSVLGFAIFQPIGIFIGGLAEVLLSYFSLIINGFGKLSFATLRVDEFGWVAFTSSYVVILAIFIWAKALIRRNERSKVI